MDFKKNLAALIKVKTIVTFTVIAVFAYLAIIGEIEAADVMAVVMLIVGFFFAKAEPKTNKKDDSGEAGEG